MFCLYIVTAPAVIHLQCGEHCPQHKSFLECNVQGSAMEWESNQFNSDIEFLGSAVGDIKQDGIFTATLSGKAPNNTHVSSTLTFTVSDYSLDGAVIYCQDLLDGHKLPCQINITCEFNVETMYFNC